MVLEVLVLDVKPGSESPFETDFRRAVPFLERAPGCLSARLLRCVEHPQRYRLFVEWEQLEDHTKRFRASPDRTKFAELIMPHVEHLTPAEHHTIV
jgi:heme-degrading monooxygenase HmoA